MKYRNKNLPTFVYSFMFYQMVFHHKQDLNKQKVGL